MTNLKARFQDMSQKQDGGFMKSSAAALLAVYTEKDITLKYNCYCT